MHWRVARWEPDSWDCTPADRQTGFDLADLVRRRVADNHWGYTERDLGSPHPELVQLGGANRLVWC